MANTGITWDANWTALTQSPVTLTQGGTVQDTGETGEITLATKAACLLSFDVDYSASALSGTGLVVTIRRDIDDTVWETAESASVSFEMVHVNGGTVRKTIALSASEFYKFVVQLDWGNATGGSSATTAIAVKYGDIPVAS